jgi:heterodisulfide reductase subunit C
MDHSPRELIGMIRSDLKDEVMVSNTFWTCASCYHCTVRCPAGINITDLMYGLKRYTIWNDQYQEDLVGPVFSEAFVKTIVRSGRSYEPVLAPAYIFSFSIDKFFQEVQTATNLMLKGRIPVLPARIKRLENFRRMVGRIIPVGGD